MNIQRPVRSFFSAISAVFLLFTQAGVADWAVEGPVNEDYCATLAEDQETCIEFVKQNIVIVVSENPRSNPERTCLAVTLAKSLAKNPMRPQNVTLFATLDGAALGVESEISNPRFKCPQANGSEISLLENLQQFLFDASLEPPGLNDDHLVLCPLCYNERFSEAPDYGVLPGDGVTSGMAVIDVFANADKVLGF